MASKKYFFQNKRGFTKKFFEKGLSATTYILLSLKEAGEGFLDSLPDCYPSFALMKMMFGRGKYKPKFKKEVVRLNLCRLKKQGLIARNPKKKVYYLTEEGKELVVFIEDRLVLLNAPWDGKFRIVVFDIPENKKGWRRWLRQQLSFLQFQMLQESVYIGKRPLPQGFYQEINDLGLNRYVFVLTVGEIDKNEEILELFA